MISEFVGSQGVPWCLADFMSFGVAFQLVASDEMLLSQMCEMLPLSSARLPDNSNKAQRFTLSRIDESNSYRAYVDDELTAESSELPRLLEEFRRELMVYVASQAPDRVFVHAGVVGWKGGALVFPGKSFAGKTTLVAELVRAGATYYSDEYAVIDANGRVHPYARDLQMRLPGRPEQHALTVEELGGDTGVVDLPVIQILFVEYADRSHWSPEPVSAGMAVLEMLRHTISVQRTPARVMNILSKMMSKGTAWRSQRGEATAAARAILGLVADLPLAAACWQK